MLGVIFDRIMKLYLLLVVTAVWGLSAARDCNPEDELPCLATDECVHKLQWCDHVSFNCKDGSDEYFCNVDSCPESLFRCDNRKCIPAVAKCDGFDNCGDGSDEICHGPTNNTVVTVSKSELDGIFDEDNTMATAATRAARYLIRKRLKNGWNSLMPRAIVALAFAEKSGSIPDTWTSLLKKELNIEIRLSLIQNPKPSLCDLAHYINALYATCQDPRNFLGKNLVGVLRSEVNGARKMDFPFVLLTLCIAKEINPGDARRLLDMYHNTGSDELGSKALVVMALNCLSKNKQTIPRNIKNQLPAILNTFEISTVHLLSSFDVYTKALHMQALNTLGYKPKEDLAKYQHLDGSFGDVLATYYAMPVLLNTSLLDLKCKRSKDEAIPVSVQLPNQFHEPKKVSISLWIERGTYVDTHSVTITLEGNKTFYDAMKIAEAKNSIFRFLYDRTSSGKRIYSLDGIPNDAEAGKSWILYRDTEARVKLHSKTHLVRQKQGVDAIFPRTGDHFVFRYEPSYS